MFQSEQTFAAGETLTALENNFSSEVLQKNKEQIERSELQVFKLLFVISEPFFSRSLLQRSRGCNRRNKHKCVRRTFQKAEQNLEVNLKT